MKTPFYLLLFLLIGGLILPTYAQKTHYIGKINEVAALYKTQAQAAANKAANPVQPVQYRIAGYELALRLQTSKQDGNADLFFGDVNNLKGSHFYLKVSAQGATGYQ